MYVLYAVFLFWPSICCGYPKGMFISMGKKIITILRSKLFHIWTHVLQGIKHSPGKLSTAFVCRVDVRLCVHVKGIWPFHVLPLS